MYVNLISNRKCRCKWKKRGELCAIHGFKKGNFRISILQINLRTATCTILHNAELSQCSRIDVIQSIHESMPRETLSLSPTWVEGYACLARLNLNAVRHDELADSRYSRSRYVKRSISFSLSRSVGMESGWCGMYNRRLESLKNHLRSSNSPSSTDTSLKDAHLALSISLFLNITSVSIIFISIHTIFANRVIMQLEIMGVFQTQRTQCIT